MKLRWGLGGDRRFETGVDKGVLYVDGIAVAWNGLTSVAEDSTGGDITPYYIDGIKYLNVAASEEFEATIEAFTYPDEFGVCDGTAVIGNGLFATQQQRKPFNLSYRTRLGNDIEGIDHGYKIHLVYGATASPSPRANSTMGDSIVPENFSWKIVTKPSMFRGIKPTSHFIIDSTETPSDLMDQIEDLLYGTDSIDPRLPSASELQFIFNSYENLVYDDGLLIDNTVFLIVDGGTPSDSDTDVIDGGTL